MLTLLTIYYYHDKKNSFFLLYSILVMFPESDSSTNASNKASSKHFNLFLIFPVHICVFVHLRFCESNAHFTHTHPLRYPLPHSTPATWSVQSADHHALERKQQDEFVKQHENQGSAGASELGTGTGAGGMREVKSEKPIRPIK